MYHQLLLTITSAREVADRGGEVVVRDRAYTGCGTGCMRSAQRLAECF